MLVGSNGRENPPPPWYHSRTMRMLGSLEHLECLLVIGKHWSSLFCSLSKHTHALEGGQPATCMSDLGSKVFAEAGCLHISQTLSGIPDNQCPLSYCHLSRPLEEKRPPIVATVV